ncbi:MAG: hypothetical protein ACTSPB_00240 [Candidatus Thorarchaeota archaeon]
MEVDESRYNQRMANNLEGERLRARNCSVGEKIRRAVYGDNFWYESFSDEIIFDKERVGIIFMLLSIVLFVSTLIYIIMFANLFLWTFFGGAICFCLSFIFMVAGNPIIARFRVYGEKVTITTKDTEFARKLKESDIDEQLKQYEIVLEVK